MNGNKKQMKPIKKRERETQQLQVELAKVTDTETTTTRQWEVRRSLCLALNLGMTRIYLQNKYLLVWRKLEPMRLCPRAGSRIMPSCTLTTRLLATSVHEMMEFFRKEQLNKEGLTRVFEMQIVSTSSRALKEYEDYLSEVSEGDNY